MRERYTAFAKRVATELIEISRQHNDILQRWSDLGQYPNDLTASECAGFINKETAPQNYNIVLDIQAPASAKTASLRIWFLQNAPDERGVERFDTIQLTFEVEHTAGQVYAQKGATITREDLLAVLDEPATQLTHMIIGNQSGKDASGENLGERYDVHVTEFASQDHHTLEAVLRTVLERFRS